MAINNGDGDPDAVFNGAPFSDPDDFTGPNTIWFNTAANGACCVSRGCSIVMSNQCAEFGGDWSMAGACADCPGFCIGDLDGSKEVDINDLLILLDAFGNTCP